MKAIMHACVQVSRFIIRGGAKEKDILNKLNLTADMEATERKQGRKRANPPEHSTPRRKRDQDICKLF